MFLTLVDCVISRLLVLNFEKLNMTNQHGPSEHINVKNRTVISEEYRNIKECS
jgi:hypothetical protein